jgi:hypothetical protein
VGIVFVVVIYVLGRNRRRRNDSIIEDIDEALPEFSAQNLDDVDRSFQHKIWMTSMKVSVKSE